ncbi:MAG: transposase zinc-binding domain-containing protein [Cyclobacteriaceae bacterium]
MSNRYPSCQLSDIIRAFHKDFPVIASNTWKARTLYTLMRCRTAEMGGHIDRCDNSDCNKLHISYNSCRNRHCPRCQGHLRERWIQDREKDLLNASYFHSLSRVSGSYSPCLIRSMN